MRLDCLAHRRVECDFLLIPLAFLFALAKVGAHPEEFSRRFKASPPDKSKHSAPALGEAVSLLDGCADGSRATALTAIRSAIAIGRRLDADSQHLETSYRVYEGTALRLERDLACVGIRDLLTESLAQATRLDEFPDKAGTIRFQELGPRMRCLCLLGHRLLGLCDRNQ